MEAAEARPVTAVILAGGMARRFKGEDKGLITLNQLPLAAWVAGGLAGHAAEILVNANRNLMEYARLGYPVVPDYLPEFPGPLAGLLSAARTAQQAWLLTVPTDAPFLPLDLVGRLHDHAMANDLPLVRAADETGIHYALMLVRRELMGDLEDYVREGGRQVKAWQDRHPNDTLYFGEDPYAFLNINTPEDLKKAERVAHRYQR
ncbi:MAG TPA: molybdenum cofactor guanylyltransferase MobA [Thiobacillaceae bacterium]|nr:molybdenum cofactor guanylyltransferase MobA [Thiobacillaceae bacterium]HNI08282.1 molybdenum cofactor guanylyltransferase MobA [Thiobacillaceae bacterium]